MDFIRQLIEFDKGFQYHDFFPRLYRWVLERLDKIERDMTTFRQSELGKHFIEMSRQEE